MVGCVAATQKKPGVNPLYPKHVFTQVARAKQENPNAKIIVFMHWNYELELYPQPLHRELAFACVDRGADAVIGAHSHCVQDIEIYKNAPIVYGLGNWCFPWKYFWRGKLAFPEIAKRQLAFEWHPKMGEMKAHYFEYQEAARLEYLWTKDCAAENLGNPFVAHSKEDYRKWFKENRRKKKGLPVYAGMNSTFWHHFLDLWVWIRQKMIGFLLMLGVKKGPR